jgi:hypothetical protein
MYFATIDSARDAYNWWRIYKGKPLTPLRETRDHVARRRRLLTFSQELQELVSRDTISTSVAEAIASASRETQDQIIEAEWKHLDNLVVFV